jgi:hypothetical protein
METMGDLLAAVREFSSREFSKDVATEIFGWGVEEVAVRTPEPDKSTVAISFKDGLFLDARYFLNPELIQLGDNVEFTLYVRTDLTARISYNIHHAEYIHGQGYIRLAVARYGNPLAQRMISDFYDPAMRKIYRPIIESFKGFYARDYFGIAVNQERAEIYYSPVSSRSEGTAARISDVVERLRQLDILMQEPQVKQALAELDLKLSFLPSLLGSSISDTGL